MRKLIIKLTESDLHRIIKDSVCQVITETIRYKLPRLLYHKAPIAARKSIMKNGLIPSIGDSYKAHWDDREDLKPYVFLYDHNTVNNGEYDSTYDDDIYAVDVSQLDKKHIFKDPDKSMKGCLAYDIPIPISAIKIVYKGSKRDSSDLSVHSHIYEGINNGVEFKEGSDEYGGRSVGAYYNGDEVGYLNYYICYPDDIYSNISDSIEDGDDIAYDVVKRLDNNKRVIDLADIDVGKDFRNMGISKRLLEYVLSKYSGYQFYLRVCPTDGVDETTLANSVMKYGFIKVVESDDGGTFLIKK
jgi:GNAT superfamily N-acetyltransferase